MTNLTQDKTVNPAIVQNAQALVDRYKAVSRIERKAIFNQIDAFLPNLGRLDKIFWLKLRLRLLDIDAPKFTLGRLLITPGAQESLEAANQEPADFLSRHQTGDWGDVDADDAAENDFSLEEGFRMLSSYRTSLDAKIWIITEADRRSTTILLPEEY